MNKIEQTENIGNSAGDRLIPAAKWSEFHSWPPIGGLRHLIFNSAKNGFSRVIRRVGRRVLISEREFFRWANDQQQMQQGDKHE